MVAGLACGQVWWSESPSLGRRPVAVLTRDEGLRVLPRVLVAPATTTIRGLPTEVHLDEHDGMPRPCVLNLDTPELLSRGFLVDYITTLSLVRQHEVCRALSIATGCSWQ